VAVTTKHVERGDPLHTMLLLRSNEADRDPETHLYAVCRLY
jgi:hypothetical protein